MRRGRSCAGFVGNQLEMVGFATDDDADGNQCVKFSEEAKFISAMGISSAPGTVATVMFSSATPNSWRCGSEL